MINKAKRDNCRRNDFLNKMCELHFYKFLVQSKFISSPIRRFLKQETPLGLKGKIRNRCIITGRSRGIYRFCKLSRNLLQEKALAGDLMGVSKSSW